MRGVLPITIKARQGRLRKSAANLRSVSYTHLDVYKRQALYIQKEDTKMLYGQIDNAMFWLYVRDPDLAKDDVLKIADSIAPLEE